MADTLLFRGGSSADIAVSTVQNRELVIDTDTDQIVSGASKKKTVMEDSNGDVAIGGGNISLNSNGSADLTGSITLTSDANKGLTFVNTGANPGTVSLDGISYGDARLKYDRQFYLFGAGTERLRISSSGNILIGGTIPSSPAISLNANGSITAGTYNSLTIGLGGGSITTNTAVGITALSNNTTGHDNTVVGQSALVANTIGAENTALGRQALFNSTTGDYNTAVGRTALRNNIGGNFNVALGRDAGFYIKGDNNTILGAYKGTVADATLSDTVIISAGTAERMRIDSSGSVGIGGTLPSSPSISLNANGSADFNAPNSTGLRLGSRYETKVAYIGIDANDAPNPTQSWSNSCWIGFDSQASEKNILYRANNNHIFASANGAEKLRLDSSGNVKIGGTLPASPNIELKADGSTVFKGKTHEFGNQSAGGPQYLTVTSGGSGATGRFGYGLRDRPFALAATSVTASTLFCAGTTGYWAFRQNTDDWTTLGPEVARIDNDGSVLIGGTPNSAPNITLSAADGSALFAGGVESEGVVQVTRPTSSTLDVWRGYAGTTLTSAIKADGTAVFRGPVSIGGMAAANTIDVYEEGTWTPSVIEFAGAAIPFTLVRSNYVRIGQSVTIQALLTLTAASNGQDIQPVIGGLPFTPKSRSTVQLSTSNSTIYTGGYSSGATFVCRGNSRITCGPIDSEQLVITSTYIIS